MFEEIDFIGRLHRRTERDYIGRVVEHAYASSPWTVPSFGTLLTGLDPSVAREIVDDTEFSELPALIGRYFTDFPPKSL